MIGRPRIRGNGGSRGSCGPGCRSVCPIWRKSHSGSWGGVGIILFVDRQVNFCACDGIPTHGAWVDAIDDGDGFWAGSLHWGQLQV
eukprot:scaffold16847_cov66-Attheya_sp.AAC.2